MHTDLLSKTKSELIQLIKRNIEISVDDGAESLDLATTTVRQHLTALEHKGLVETRSQKHGRGRPRLMYSLTSRGQAFFEEHDQEFLSGLMKFLFEKGLQDVVHEYIDRLCASLVNTVDVEGADAAERIDVITSFFQQRGFMPELAENAEGDTLLTFRHCPFSTVAECSEKVCEAEENWLKRLWGDRVERVNHRPAGADACAYCLVGCAD